MAEVKDLQEYRNKRRKKEKKRSLVKWAIIITVATLLVAFVALFETFFNVNIFEALGIIKAPDGYPAAITGGTPKNIIPLGKNVAIITETEVMIYDEYGTLSMQDGHNCTNPCVRTNGKRGIVFDVGYYSYKLLNGTSSAKGFDHDNQITSAAIASNGSYAIASASSKYLTELTVKSKNNEQIASWKSVNNYINTVAFSNDSMRVAATGLYSEDGLARTTLRILDLRNEQEPVVSDTEIVGSAAIALCYLDNGNIAIVCDDRTVITDPNGKKLFDYSYIGKLHYYNLNQYGAFVMCEKDGEYIATMLYDAKNAGASMKVSNEFKAEEHNASGVYILENDKLNKYDREFNKISTEKDLDDAIGITCADNGTYVMTFSQIQKIGEQDETR